MMKKTFSIILILLFISEFSYSQTVSDTTGILRTQDLINRVVDDTNIKVYKNKQTIFEGKKEFVKISALGGIVVGAVIATVKLKSVANDSYDNYLLTQNPSDLDKSRKYDVYSAITLVVTQAAFAGLLYFLFFDK